MDMGELSQLHAFEREIKKNVNVSRRVRTSEEGGQDLDRRISRFLWSNIKGREFCQLKAHDYDLR